MKRIFLSVLLISAFYQISNAQEAVVKNKESALIAEKKSAVDKSLKEKKEDKEVTKDVAEKQKGDQVLRQLIEKENESDQFFWGKEKSKKIKKPVIYTPDQRAHKGKVVFMQRGHTGFFVGRSKQKDLYSNPYGLETTYELGVGYFITDRFRLEALVGMGIWGLKSSERPMNGGLFLPIELVGSWNLSDREYWKKNTELFVSLGYDVNIIGLQKSLYPGESGDSMKKISLNIGITFSKKIGIRVSYVPYQVYTSSDELGHTWIIDNYPSFGLAFTYRP